MVLPVRDSVPQFGEFAGRLRKICCSLPEVVEEPAWVGTRWRIRANTFAHVLPIEGGRPPVFSASAGTAGAAVVMTFRSSGVELDVLRQMGPPFFRMPWKNAFVGLHLDTDTDWTEVTELVTESYCLVAPKNLTARIPRPAD